MSYDTKCHDLAKAFASDWPKHDNTKRQGLLNELAQRIQAAIEDFEEEQGLQS